MDLISTLLLMSTEEESALGSHWIATLSSAGDERGFDITTDNNDNIYVCGYTDIYGTAGYAEILIAKYNNGGNILWQRVLGGTSSEQRASIVTDTNNNIYVCGGAFIAKYNTNGLILWQKELSREDGSCVGYGITIDNNNIYICGISQVQGITPRAFVAKYDTNGNILWQRILGEGTGTYIWDSIVSDDNSVYLCGYGIISVGLDAILAKYDTNGNILWQKSLSGASSDIGSGIATDNNSNVYITATSANDLVIAKYNTNGNILWQRSLSGVGNDGGRDIVIDSSGNVYVCGYTVIQNIGHILIAKYDTNGNILWQRALGGNINNKSGTGITLDSNNNLCISGYIYGSVEVSSVLIAKLPDDGSLTGVYGDFTYAESTLAPANSILTDSALTLTSATSTFISRNYSLNSINSTLVSTTTQLNP